MAKEITEKNLRDQKLQHIIGFCRDLKESYDSINLAKDVMLRNREERDVKETMLYDNVCHIYERIVLKRINEDYKDMLAWIKAFEGED